MVKTTAMKATTPPLSHLAIIMDGNGRWAMKRNLPRLKGHQEGAQRVIEVAKACKALNIPYLSLFAFSTENWRRSSQEVNGLFRLLDAFVKKYLKTLHEDQVRLVISGRLEGIPASSKALLLDAIEATKGYDRYTLNICVNYGGQDEIVRASIKAMKAIQAGTIKEEDLNPKTFSQFLDTTILPPIDALIRTSGEMRISNFMLYQAAYAELIFIDTLWPDFKTPQLKAALKRYASRKRRFGSV
jgi:undecaprenyl diphosphate synthase